jgi:hypothetical protein
MAAALQRQQLDSFDETLQQNQEVQSDLIRSVQDVSEYFSKSDREFSDAILMIQTEREQITQSLAVTDRWFQGEVAKMKSWISQMDKRDDHYYKTLRERWSDAYGAYYKQAMKTFKDVTGASSLTDTDFNNPVATLAGRYQERAQKKADALLAKYTEAKTQAEADAAEVGEKHTTHVADTGDLKSTMNEIKNYIDTSLMDPGKGNEKLEEEILDFSDDKDGTIKNDLKTIAEEQDKAWDPEGRDEYSVYYRAKERRDDRTAALTTEEKKGGEYSEYNTANLLDEFGDKKPESKGVEYKQKAETDTAAIQAQTTAVTTDVTAMEEALDKFSESETGTEGVEARTGTDVPTMGVQVLQKKVDELLGDTGSDPSSIKETTDRLAEFAQNLAEFPYMAKDKVRNAENEIATKLADENEAMYSMIDDSVKAIKQVKDHEIKVGKHAIDLQAIRTEDKVNEEYNKLVATKTRQQDADSGTIQKTLGDKQVQIKDLTNDMQKIITGGKIDGVDVPGIQNLNTEMSNIKSSADQQETLLKQQIKAVEDRQKTNLGTAEMDNKRKAGQMVESVEGLEGDVEAATENGRKAIIEAGTDAEGKIKNAALSQINALNARMIAAKSDATKSVSTYNSLKALQNQITAFKARTDDLEASIGQTSSQFGDFVTEAKSTAQSLPDEAAKAVAEANREVAEQIDTLKADGSETVEDMSKAIGKLSQKVEKQAARQQSDLTHAFEITKTEDNDVTASLRSALDEVVEDSDKTAAYVGTSQQTVNSALQTSEEAADHAYADAQQTLERYTATFRGASADGSAAPDPSSQLGLFQARAVDAVANVRDKAESMAEEADGEVLKAAKAAAQGQEVRGQDEVQGGTDDY